MGGRFTERKNTYEIQSNHLNRSQETKYWQIRHVPTFLLETWKGQKRWIIGKGVAGSIWYSTFMYYIYITLTHILPRGFTKCNMTLPKRPHALHHTTHYKQGRTYSTSESSTTPTVPPRCHAQQGGPRQGFDITLAIAKVWPRKTQRPQRI